MHQRGGSALAASHVTENNIVTLMFFLVTLPQGLGLRQGRTMALVAQDTWPAAHPLLSTGPSLPARLTPDHGQEVAPVLARRWPRSWRVLQHVLVGTDCSAPGQRPMMSSLPSL